MPETIWPALEAFSASALMEFSPESQMLKTCEELAELTTQLCKRLSQSPKSIDADIVDEIADGFVVLAQMRHLFGMEKVDERVLFKLNRTMERIRARNQKMPEEKGCV